MKAKSKVRRLSVQLISMTVAIFVIGTVIGAFVLYKGSRDMYLEAKDEMITYDLDQLEDFLNNTVCIDWLGEYIREHDDYAQLLDPDDYDTMNEQIPEYTSDELDMKSRREKLEAIDEKYKPLFARFEYTKLGNYLNSSFTRSNYEKLYCIDISEENCGYVYCDSVNIHENGDNIFRFAKSGMKWDYNVSDHPAIKKLRAGAKGVQFEIASVDNKDNDTSYIGYVPVGDGNIALCICYDWAPFRKQLMQKVMILVAVLLGAMLLTCILIFVFLRRVVLKPLNSMRLAVVDYTGDKDSAKIVSKMFAISDKNEFGYLADSISDLALEIDHYTGEVARAEKELYDAKVQIMVSQIRPHFMYNALSSIAMLCTLDPETAQEATVTFADYLRGNMDSLKQTEPVPFETELEHLKKYLYIEKLRFGKKLNIVYDIQATDFKLPLLSIQPLVENAVKHGVGMKKKGGTVTISTKQTENGFEVIISDDGVGFDTNAPRKDDGRSHVGMDNTRKRLKDLCGADVVITSVIGEGTTARVIIPKEERDNEDTVR